MSLLDVPLKKAWRSISPNAVRFVEQNKFRANRFIFDNETIARISYLVRDRPDVIFDNLQFAKWPYETTYIEWRSDIYSGILNTAAPHNPGLPDPNDVDTSVGVLFHKGIAATVVGLAGEPATESATMMRVYNYGSPRLPGTFRVDFPEFESKLAVMFGASYHFVKNMPQDVQQNVRGMVEFDMEGRVWDSRNPERTMQAQMIEGAGEFRTICTLLLWLNQSKHVDIVRVPASRKMLRNKPIAYAAHNVVTLKDMTTKRMAAIMRQISMERETPRAHKVRGFFRNYHKVPGCIHEWPFEPNEKEQWVCGRCGQLRVWVDEFQRGDASKGFVTKEYTTA